MSYSNYKEIEIFLKPISLDDMVLSRYILILDKYPMKESKKKIYLSLDKKQRVGMLNRYLLSIASKLGIYESFISEIIYLKRNYKIYKKFSNDDHNVQYWNKKFNDVKIRLTYQYNMLLKIIIEEIDKREKIRYLRKIKMNNVLQK